MELFTQIKVSLGDLGSSSSGAGGSDAGSSSQSSNMMYELNKNIKKSII